MKVWAVMISPEGINGRYIDSLWVEHVSAIARITQLKCALTAGRLGTSTVWELQLSLEDARLESKTKVRDRRARKGARTPGAPEPVH